MSYNREELSQLSRKELQKLCKQTNGQVKANKKTSDLVDDLAEHYDREESEMKEMEAQMKICDEVDLNTTWTVDESSDDAQCEGENDEACAAVTNPTTTSDATVGQPEEEVDEVVDSDTVALSHSGIDDEKEILKQSNENVQCPPLKCEELATGDKSVTEDAGESGDALLKEVLMQEVERRAQEKISKIPRLFVADNVKIPTATSLTQSVATPEALRKKNNGLKTSDSIDVYLAKKQRRAEGQLKISDKENKKSVPKLSLLPKLKRKSAVRVDSDITIKFTPQVESTPNNAGRRISPRLSLIKSGMDRRKTFIKSASSAASPIINKCVTPKVKTPKFDIKESLKKPLKYKPHTGKLKSIYFSPKSTGLPRSSSSTAENASKNIRKKVSVKEMNKNLTTRDRRRQEASGIRSNNRNAALDKRRGILL